MTTTLGEGQAVRRLQQGVSEVLHHLLQIGLGLSCWLHYTQKTRQIRGRVKKWSHNSRELRPIYPCPENCLCGKEKRPILTRTLVQVPILHVHFVNVFVLMKKLNPTHLFPSHPGLTRNDLMWVPWTPNQDAQKWKLGNFLVWVWIFGRSG